MSSFNEQRGVINPIYVGININQLNKQMENGDSSIVYRYLVKEIVDSAIVEDGGQECYEEIPKMLHLILAVFGGFLYLFVYKKWNSKLLGFEQVNRAVLKPNLAEYTVGALGLVALSLTMYYKISSGKGLFILNPCHVAISGVIVLCVMPSTVSMRKLHSMWTSWLFGATLAIIVPHLAGISSFQVFLYYFQHLIIVPIGPVILYRRYGFLKPTFQNQFACFSSLGLYQIFVLFPLSVLTMVNLNFALCHSPGDPFYPIFGIYYFVFAMFYLNLASYLARWAYYFFVYPCRYVWKQWKSPKQDQDKTN